jgi:hypothetical protein
MGSRGVGGPIAAASVEDFKDSAKSEFLMNELVEGMQYFARYASNHKQEFVLWEPTPIGREMLIDIDEGYKLYERLNKDIPIPIHFVLDVGHQCGYEQKEKNRDTYKWFEELGQFAPVVHLQQTDGLWDRHWAFTKEHHDEGIVKIDKVLESLDKSGLDEVYLFPEIIYPYEIEESKLLEEMDETFEYLKQFV